MGVLGIDAGGSSTRWLLLDDAGRELASGRLGPLSGHLFSEAAKAEAEARLAELAVALSAHGSLDRVVAGITGLSAGSETAAMFQRALARQLGLSPGRVHVCDDMHIAYVGAFLGEAGVLVYAGTGSIAYHERPDGSVVRIGGYGYLIDDAGGGFAIGRAGLKQVLRWADALGRPADRPLAHAIYEALGAADWPTIRHLVYAGGRSRVALLAPAVAAASEAGDEAARAILEESAQALAELAELLLSRLGHPPPPVALAGGVARLSPYLVERFEAALSGRRVRLITAEPVRAAALLALRAT